MEKLSSEKSAQKCFLYSHEHRDKKNARNTFFRNTRIVRAKNVEEKIVRKTCEKRFFIFTRIS